MVVKERIIELIPKWEYKRIVIRTTSIYDDNLIKEFNTLGQDGWELVNYHLVPICSGLTAIQDELKGVTHANCVCIFKKANYESIELTNKQQSNGNQD